MKERNHKIGTKNFNVNQEWEKRWNKQNKKKQIQPKYIYQKKNCIVKVINSIFLILKRYCYILNYDVK